MTTPPTDPSPATTTAESGAAVRKAAINFTYRGEGTGLFQRLMWGTGRVISRILSILFFRLHVRGQRNVPRTGGVLLLSNHQSFLDPWLLGIAPSRQLHYMARDSLFKGGFLQWLAETLNTFPVRRGAADLAAIRNAVERLDKGYIVTVFPEGTRSEDGAIQPVIGGFSLILNRCKTGVPILPAVIDGAFEAWPRHAKLPHPRPIRIAYGTPIPPAEWQALSPEQLGQRIRQEFVRLQAALSSRHAEVSAARMAQDAADTPAEPPRKRRPR
jgi:1-acyl-sn-glycerol-3-phosphate acyltransferase